MEKNLKALIKYIKQRKKSKNTEIRDYWHGLELGVRHGFYTNKFDGLTKFHLNIGYCIGLNMGNKIEIDSTMELEEIMAYHLKIITKLIELEAEINNKEEINVIEEVLNTVDSMVISK